jgi:hypothetical protein
VAATGAIAFVRDQQRSTAAWASTPWLLCTRSGCAATVRHTVALSEKGQAIDVDVGLSLLVQLGSRGPREDGSCVWEEPERRGRRPTVVTAHSSLCWQRSQRDCGGEEGRAQRSVARRRPSRRRALFVVALLSGACSGGPQDRRPLRIAGEAAASRRGRLLAPRSIACLSVTYVSRIGRESCRTP